MRYSETVTEHSSDDLDLMMRIIEQLEHRFEDLECEFEMLERRYQYLSEFAYPQPNTTDD